MRYPTPLLSVLAACLCSCHSYTPMPVDLDQHLRDFQQRSLVGTLASDQPQDDLLPSQILRSQARELAKLFHPDARLARLRAGVATAKRDFAGTWVDPQLQTNLQNILESLPYRWVGQAQIVLTVPINGRLEKQRELANRQRDEALVDAWAIEQRVANQLDQAWIEWSAANRSAAILEQTCHNLEQLAEFAQALVDTGSLTRPGARLFTLEHQQQLAMHAMAVANEQAARLEVLRRMGLHPDAELTLSEDFDVQPFVADATERRSALQTSPRLLSQQLEHATAEANLHLQVRNQWPDLQLWPGWQEEDAQPRAGFGINLNLPIWTGNDPAIAQAVAQRELTATALRSALEQLLQELAIAEVRQQAAAQQAASFRELIAPATQQIEDSRSLAEVGQLNIMLMLDALLRAQGVQMQTIQADQNAALATITINHLLTDPQSRTPTTTKGASQ